MITRASFMILAISSLMFTATASAADVLIDNFSDGSSTLTAIMPGTPDSSTETGTGIIGTEREALLEVDTNSFIASNVAHATLAIAPGENLNFANDPGVASTLTLTYDGVGMMGLGGVDATDGGMNDLLQVSVVFVDLAFTFEFTLTDGSGSTATVSVVDPSTGDVNIALSDFVGVDLTDIEEIVWVIESPLAGDIVVDTLRFTVIPEPSSILMGLTAIGTLSGLAFIRRRRRLAVA